MPLLPALALACALALLAGGPARSDPVRVASSGTHTLVVAPDGTVLCQGRNQYKVCGRDSATPFVEKLAPVPGVPKGQAVAVADPWTSLVLGEDGRVYAWGQNSSGLFGGNDRGPTHVRTEPTPVAGLDRVIGIAAFVRGGAALRDDGTVWVWGANKFGQLGLGDTESRAAPRRIPSLAGVTWISAQADMSAARQADGSWVVWGMAPSAKASTDDGPPVLSPSPLPALLKDAADVAAGVVSFRDGSVRTWGNNAFGSLGTGAGVDASATGARAVLVRSLSGIVQVWSGGARSLALKSDGTLYLWGPSGSTDAGSFRVPTAMATFKLDPPRKP